jgi:hypothetical protein
MVIIIVIVMIMVNSTSKGGETASGFEALQIGIKFLCFLTWIKHGLFQRLNIQWYLLNLNV